MKLFLFQEMRARLDETEATALKGEKRMLTKLEQRVHDLEIELADECRRHAETLKNYRNRERKVRELQFQADEDRKSNERMHDIIEKMQTKIKTYKRQLEEAVIINFSVILNRLKYFKFIFYQFKCASGYYQLRKISSAPNISIEILPQTKRDANKPELACVSHSNFLPMTSQDINLI